MSNSILGYTVISKNFSFLLTMGLLWFLPFQGVGQKILCVDGNFSEPQIFEFSLGDSNLVTVPLASGTLPQDITFNKNTGEMYLTELLYSKASIKSLSADLDSVTEMLADQSALRGIALDESSEALFWTSSDLQSGSSLMTSSLSDVDPKSLLEFPAQSKSALRGLAIDTQSQMIYFADYGTGQILKTSMDSTGTTEEFKGGLEGPYGVAIDREAGKIFWSEFITGSLNSAKLDGSDEQEILSGLSGPQYISLDASSKRIYWTEAGPAKVRSVSYTGSAIKEIPIPAKTPMGLYVLPEGFTPVGESPLAERFLFSVFPPQKLKVKFHLDSKTRIAFKVHSLQGKLVFRAAEETLLGGSHEKFLDLNQAEAGVYFLTFISAGKKKSHSFVLP